MNEPWIMKHVNLYKQQYDAARNLVIYENYSALNAAKQYGVIPSYLSKYVKQVEPNYYSQKLGYIVNRKSNIFMPDNTFVGRKYTISSQYEIAKANDVLARYKHEGLMLVENNSTIICDFCKCYVNWKYLSKLNKHLNSTTHLNNKIGMYHCCFCVSYAELQI
jgi:hypothetical protein